MKFLASILICVTLTLPTLAQADDAVELSQVTIGDENGHFAATLQFNNPVAVADLKVDVLKDALNITIPNGALLGEKNFIEVGKENIKSISSSSSGTDILTKIIFAKGVDTSKFKDFYRFVSTGNQVKILFRNPGQEWSLAALGIDGLTPTSLEPEVAKVKEEKNIELNLNKKEEEIPVLTSVTEKKGSAKSPYMRLVLSLGVIGLLAFGLVHFSKWWQKRHGRNVDTNQIRILTQHHLGPKKSLAIIRVAGETILIGVTDANISMIKTLALLEDEEVPETVPQSFAGELKKNEDEQEDDSAFSQIRDRISTRIKEMRPL